jgi:hypothetical protein
MSSSCSHPAKIWDHYLSQVSRVSRTLQNLPYEKSIHFGELWRNAMRTTARPMTFKRISEVRSMWHVLEHLMLSHASFRPVHDKRLSPFVMPGSCIVFHVKCRGFQQRCDVVSFYFCRRSIRNVRTASTRHWLQFRRPIRIDLFPSQRP